MARRLPSNAEIGRALREMAWFLEMQGVAFKPRAYEKAARAIESAERPAAELWTDSGLAGLRTIPTVGPGIGARVEELLRTGRIGELERLRAATPIDASALARVEGLGPKHAKALYDALGVRTPEEIETACRAGRVRALPHFGARSEARLLEALGAWKRASGRRPIGACLPLAHAIEARLRAFPATDEVAIAGSLRRFRDTIGDLDFVVASHAPAAVARHFATLPEVAHVHARGPSKVLVRLASGLDADLRIVPRESFGAALAYFTGSKEHNLRLRRIARQRGLKLNEYGLFRGEGRLAGRTEEELYAALGMAFVPPELRENRGEIEAALAGPLPPLLDHGALRGDLQVQTDWTDGAASIEEMVRAARARGLDYIAITDHTHDLGMARGSDEAKLLEQAQAVRALDARLRGFRVLAGAEVNIRKDGSLDVADEALAQLDVVGAAVHSSFGQSREAATRRLIRAMENPHVDVLFHPTARQLGRREPLDLDFDAILAAAKRTGTVLEIDAIPDRLDLDDEHARRASQAGVALVIDSDAHHPSHFAYLEELGVPLARRAWLGPADVLNTRPVAALLAALKDRRGGRAGRRAGRARAAR